MNNKTVVNSDLRSQSLDLLRFPLAVIVLTVHVISPNGLTVNGTSVDASTFPAVEFIMNFINGFLRSQSVPVYYFISGFVFFLGVNFNWDIYINKIKNRFHSLFIPFTCWNMLALLWMLFKSLPCFENLAPGLNSISHDYSLKAIIMTFWDASQGVIPIDSSTNQFYPINSPLWFIRDLMIVVITTPLIYLFIKKLRIYAVYILLILWFIADTYSLKNITQIITAYTFFSLGAYMSIFNKDMITEFGRYSKASFMTYLILGIGYMICAYVYPDACNVIKRLNIIAGLFFAYNIAAYLLKNSICKPNKFLSSASFYIYISHFLIYNEVLKSLYYLIRPSNSISFIFLYLLAVAMCVSLLLLTFYILNRYTPNLLRILAGRK